MTIKGPFRKIEPDTRELDTIRPVQNKSEVKPAVGAKSHHRKHSDANSQVPKTSGKDKVETKFAIPSKPAALYREQSVEDYSDILIDNENPFDRRLSLINVSLGVCLCDIC